ncbi:MAG: CotH kinase family protein [Salibacteraceae bacterium]|nr:CotH kinase family protein [Salibacteraceae bacterium]
MLNRCFLNGSLFLLVLFSALSGSSQINNPDWGEAYVQDAVTKIEVTMDSADLAWMLAQENLLNDDYLEASFIYTDSDGNTHQYSGSGIRLRGNTSRYAAKKSFKINVDKFGGTEKFYGYDKLNLKGSHNDPSMLRERLAYYYMREIGGAAPLVNNMEVYINGEYKGLYVNVEQIDDDFVKTRFGNKTGNLYKCLYGASLRNSDDVWNNDVFELETNANVNDRSDLIELIDVLNNTSNEDFKTEIEKVLDVDHLLKYLAVEVLTGHWDGYSFNKNNYYLYHNTQTDKFEVIMYDTDNTFGIDWFGEDWATRNVYNWGQTQEQRPMFWRVLEVPEYRAIFTDNMYTLLNGEFSSAIFPWIDELIVQTQSAAYADTYRTLDYGFDNQDYTTSATSAFGAHVKYGIEPYIEQRRLTALAQLDWPTAVEETRTFSNDLKWFVKDNSLTVWSSDPGFTKADISLFAIDGKLLLETKNASLTQNKVLIGSLKTGCYMLLVKNNESEKHLKVIVN